VLHIYIYDISRLRVKNIESFLTQACTHTHTHTHTRARAIYVFCKYSVCDFVSGETLCVSVAAKEYLDKLVDKNFMKIYAIANVKETGQTWSEEDDFQLQKPKLNIQVQQTRCPRNLSEFLPFTKRRWNKHINNMCPVDM